MRSKLFIAPAAFGMALVFVVILARPAPTNPGPQLTDRLRWDLAAAFTLAV